VVVVVAEIKPEEYEAMDRLVGTAYASVQQFVEVAVRNQLALEVGVNGAPGGRPGSPGEDAGSDGASAPETAPPISTARSSGSSDHSWRAWVTATAVDRVPAANDVSVPNQPLWGQINRLLPIAAGVRVLSHLALEANEPFVNVDDWHVRGADVAHGLRSHLEGIDIAREHRHGERWATAFPDDAKPSRRRYMNQFLGYLRPKGEPEGGAVLLGLVVFADGDPTRVAVTKSGATWASLPNPIFDEPGDTGQTTFSRDEAAHYLRHVQQAVPAEYQLMKAVAELVDASKARTEIDERLGELYPDWASYIGTVRAGALGRLQDLGLLRRERRGLHVDYGLTPLAYELDLAEKRDR
jgi:hypothetical protein